jgi:hypothetical protein
MRTTFVVLAVVTLSGCASTHESRRPACDSCDVARPTLLQRLGLGRPLGQVPPAAPPAQVEMFPPASAAPVESSPGVSPALSVEPEGPGKPHAGAGQVKGTSGIEKARKPSKKAGQVC